MPRYSKDAADPQSQERDLRALARVFDINAGAQVAAVDVWVLLNLRIINLD